MVRLILFLMLVLFILMLKYLPLWASLVVVILLVWGLKLTFRHVLLPMLLQPLRARAKVLKGAEVQVHGITPAPAPAYDPDKDEYAADDAEDLPEDLPQVREWYYLDVTIKPRGLEASAATWEPDALVIARPGSARRGLFDEDDGTGAVHDVQVHRHGAFVGTETLDGAECQGPQRLRLHLGVAPGTRAVALRYLTETFGRIDLPDVLPSAAA